MDALTTTTRLDITPKTDISNITHAECSST
jgi:hypothetical protein